MKLLESGVRVFYQAQGIGARWLKEELGTLKVTIPLTEGCYEELVRDADSAAWNAVHVAPGQASYAAELRRQLALQASFVHRWTTTDDKFAADDEAGQAFVRIARNYALPRPWKLADPVVVEYRRLRPSYQQWTSNIDMTPVAQA